MSTTAMTVQEVAEYLNVDPKTNAIHLSRNILK